MATASQPGVGGKVVAKRREQRLATTPYDRPPKNPSWFTGVVLPSARKIALTAGIIINSILSESDSSSSEDEGDASDDDANNEGQPGSNLLSKENAISPQRFHGIETKQLIEKLILQETFSREEFDRLTRVLKSRVVDSSVEAKNIYLFSDSPANAIDQDDADIYEKAIQEARSWFQDKKVGSTSTETLARGNTNCTSAGSYHAKQGEGSPVDVARSYMKERAPWTSPTGHAGLETPLATTMKSFKEVTTRSFGYDSFSSSKNALKRSYLASGSWNIEEEKRRVRSKAIDDLLRASSSKVDPVSFSLALPHESLGTEKTLLVSREKLVESDTSNKINPTNALLDAGTSPGSVLAALDSRPVDIAHEVFPSNTAFNSKDPEAIQADVDSVAACPVKLDGRSENHTDVHSNAMNEPAVEANETPNAINGFSSSKSRISHKSNEHEVESNAAVPSNDKNPSNTTDLESHMEEVPVAMETDIGTKPEVLSPSGRAVAMKRKSRKSSKYEPAKSKKR